MEESNVEKSVLSPDHPLLEKFQKALKEHLLTRIDRVKNELHELENEKKKKRDAKETLGIQAYELQQEICRQQKTLENIVDDLTTLSAAKEEIDNVLEEDRKKNKELQEKYIQIEKTNRELQSETEAVNYLNNQLLQWEQKLEVQISVNQRISSKTMVDEKQMLKEKRDQDMLIYLLNKEVWRLESELEDLTLQMKLKQDDISELEKTVATGNTNAEALQAEIRCLMHAWQGVIVAISNRDKSLECLNEQHVKLKEKLKTTFNNIEQAKKLVKKELMENERLTMLKTRLEEDAKNCRTLIEAQTAKKNVLEQELFNIQTIIEQTDKDIEATKIENIHLEKKLRVLSKDYEGMAQKKFEQEQLLLDNIETIAANNKLVKVLMKNLHKAITKRRDVEVILQMAENKHSLIATQIQEQKFTNEKNVKYLDEVHKQQMELHKEADQVQSEKETQEILFKKRERQIHCLVNILEKMSTEKQEISSPQQMKIVELEKSIVAIQDNIKKLQAFWLREQKNLLAVSNERQEQINEMNLLKKQTMILEQKNMKQTSDLEGCKKNQERITQNINMLQNKGAMMCEDIFKKRNQKFKLDRNNVLAQNHYDTKVKDAELQILNVESEIEDIEEEKVNITKEILEVNREILEWEKKLQMAKEAVGSMKQDKAAGGELLTMTMEIHRMELIYSQMKKAQEKLTKDLTHCISRRDTIYFTAEAKAKKAGDKNATDKSRINYLRKMDDIRNKIKKGENEIKQINARIGRIEKEKQTSIQKKIEAEEKTQLLKTCKSDVLNELEETKTSRQLKFELLLIKQKKLSMYHHLSLGRKPYTIYKKEEQLSTEYKKQKSLNHILSLIANNLIMDFPNRFHAFNRMNNSLKIALVSMYPTF